MIAGLNYSLGLSGASRTGTGVQQSLWVVGSMTAASQGRAQLQAARAPIQHTLTITYSQEGPQQSGAEDVHLSVRNVTQSYISAAASAGRPVNRRAVQRVFSRHFPHILGNFRRIKLLS
jgi:hypothetical protein